MEFTLVANFKRNDGPMSKPVQILESSNYFSPDTPGMVNKDRREDGKNSFSRILSGSESAPAAEESGQLVHVPGKKLPAQQENAGDQQHAGDGLSANRVPGDVSVQPDAIEESLLANDLDLPEQIAVQASLQQALVPDGRAKELPYGQVVEQLQGRAPEAAEFAGTTDVAVQSINTDELISSREAGQQLQGQLADVPGNLPVANERVLQDIVHDTGEVRGVTVPYLTGTDSARTAAEVEPVANAVREAVQSAIANQTASRDLKQFLQQNGNHQPASHNLPVPDGTEARAVPFLQTLSENAPVMPAARISVPVGQPGWGQAVGNQVVWFVSQNISAASLRLNPQHLGPLEMQVRLDGDEASVSFTSQQGLVREALESSVPRLREMLSENGLNLVNVNVSQQRGSRQYGQGAPGSQPDGGVANAEGTSGESVIEPGVRQNITLTQGLVDFYA